MCVCVYISEWVWGAFVYVCKGGNGPPFLSLAPNSPCSWTWLWDTCMVDGAWEKALSTVRLPSAKPEVGAYITAWGLGYIMWPPTVVGTDDVMMVAGNVTGKHRHMSGRSYWSLLISPSHPQHLQVSRALLTFRRSEATQDSFLCSLSATKPYFFS